MILIKKEYNKSIRYVMIPRNWIKNSVIGNQNIQDAFLFIYVSDIIKYIRESLVYGTFAEKMYQWLVKDSSDCNDGAVSCIVGNLDAVFWIAGVNNLVIAHVKRNVSVVADDIARFCSA